MNSTTLSYERPGFAPTEEPRTGPLLEIDPPTFHANFNRKPFLIKHRLVADALFALPRLIALAKRLPPALIEYNAGDIPVSLNPTLTPHTGLSPQETLRRIEECRSWMVLKNIEQDPQYGALLHRCLDEIQTYSEALDPHMRGREGFIFISSPGSITPYHLDPEHNFLLQIRGAKSAALFDPSDRALLSEQELEQRAAGVHRNLVFKESYQAKAAVFDLTPGYGLHFPVTAPHWIKNGNEVSVSFSITFRTPATERRAIIRRVNHDLRRIGWTPTPPGQSALRDAVKYYGFRALRRADYYLRRNRATPAKGYKKAVAGEAED